MIYFTCCQSLTFAVMPFVGSLEIGFFAALLAAITTLGLFLCWFVRRAGTAATVITIACVAVLPNMTWPYLLSLDAEHAVKGWLTALDMARVDDTSAAVQMWARY